MSPVRRNFAHLTQAERDAFVAAMQQIDAASVFPDGVSYWDKQDQIHQATHVHGGPQFLPWHRELCNRLEAMLQGVDPSVALHYWDWTVDPTAAPNGTGGTVDLMTSSNMGSASGRVGTPFDMFDNGGAFAGSREDTGNPADPPQEVTRGVQSGAPGIDSDATIIGSADALPQAQQWQQFRTVLENNHNDVHGYIGGDIGFGHTAFEDPFVFLLHSNVDRLWAMWQMVSGQEWRLDPAQVYGNEAGTGGLNGISTPLEPWAGGTTPGTTAIRPWAPPENLVEWKTSLDPSVVRPPCYDTLPLSVDLTEPVSGSPITFAAVPEGVTAPRAAVFAIRACMDITLEIISGPGPDFDTPLGTTFTVPYTHELPTEGRVWITYTGTTAWATANGQMTVRCIETGDEWTIDIEATTVAKPTVASVLVLDKSGSMAWDSGIPGMRRLDVLRWAAPHYVQLMDDDDGIGIVSFDHDAYPVMGVTAAGPPVFGAGRATAASLIATHDEDGGATSIGDGVELGHNTVAPEPGYEHKALVVFSDGHENTPKYLSDVSGLLTERVFAIGLGRADQLDVAKLDAITSGSGGFLVMTGDLTVDDLFRVSKYFLQVLAGVVNTQIVLDPEGTIGPKQRHRIPFDLTEGDYRCDAILLSPAPSAVNVALETPHGDVVAAADAPSVPGMTHALAPGVRFFRFALPAVVGGRPAHAGRWHLLLELDRGRGPKPRGREPGTATVPGQWPRHAVPYSATVHARSSVELNAYVVQSSHEPGARVGLRAVLTQYGLPVGPGASVRVGVARPDGTAASVTLAPSDPGVYEGSFDAAIPGVYRLRFLARGTTLGGLPFSREALRTAAVTPGGDRVDPRPGDGGWSRLCELVECLLREEAFRKALKARGVDADELEACLRVLCRPVAGEGPNRPRPGAVTLDHVRALLDRPEVRAAVTEALVRGLTGRP